MALKRFLQIERDFIKPVCLLKSLDETTKDIELNEVKTEIGRSELSGITDTFCSKCQLIVKADRERRALSIKTCGVNPSGLNGFMLEPKKGYEGCDGDIIEVLYGRYPYKIVFPPQEIIKKNPISELMAQNECKRVKHDDKNEDNSWESIDSGKLVIYNFKNPRSSSLIASYDLDGTIITTKSGNTFPKDIDDWKFFCTEVIRKLKSLHENGYKIVLFTNQLSIGIGKLKLENFKQKLDSILLKINVPCQAFISTGNGKYRKPLLGMWKYLEEHKNSGLVIDKIKSFYVGDAAGRPEQTVPVKKKKDHSCSDRLFAINIGLSFYTPEEHFQNKKPSEYIMPTFDPRVKINSSLLEPETTKLPPNKNELIIMVGLPGSGKSFFSNNTLKAMGYVVINRDTLGSMPKCLKICEENIKDGKNCVIDNTNVTKESRKEFISIAKRLGIPFRCFLMNVSIDQLKHNIKFRDLTDPSHIKVNEMVFNGLKKKFEEPKTSEGFSEIVKVNIIPKFNNEEEESLYRMFLVDK